MRRLVLALAALSLVGAAPAEYGAWGVDLTGMPAGARPGDDFWTYANGRWSARTTIAPDRAEAGTFITLSERAEADVRALIEAPGTDRRIADYYASFMDEAGIEARGLAPLEPYLAPIRKARTTADLARLFATPGYAAPVNVGITIDPKNPAAYVGSADQGGLGLPNRDYYLQPGAKMEAIRAAYRAYLVRLQGLAGMAGAEARADRVIALETALAKTQWAPERLRDTIGTYNPKDRAQLTEMAPEFGWPRLLNDAGLGGVTIVIAGQPDAIAAAGKLLAATPIETWRDYLTLHLISDMAPYLPKAYDDARFAFYGTTLRDQPEQRARWKRGVALVNGALPEAVGPLYVARHYPPQAEREMRELIANLQAAFGERIKAASWMDAATTARAEAKLATFMAQIGRPPKWIDYAPLAVRRDDLVGNVMRSRAFDWRLQLSRLGKPVDRDLWYMSPQTVNAYYNPPMNSITFPAAILQPPFFDARADPAVNYGAIGAVIGHEMGHGFDDQGRRYDETGRLTDWWTAAAARDFEARAGRLAAQYGAFEPLPGMRVNGQLTLGENIGDLGGLEVAYAAWRRHVAQHGEPPRIDGFTGDQRFFLAFAQVWRGKRREGSLRQQVLTNPHSPEIYRVNGVVRNVDAWYRAFGVKPGDRMYLPPEQRVRIW